MPDWGDPDSTTAALEDGGNLEAIYNVLATTHTSLLREILIELRVVSALLQTGLNTVDDPETIREDIGSDAQLSSVLDS